MSPIVLLSSLDSFDLHSTGVIDATAVSVAGCTKQMVMKRKMATPAGSSSNTREGRGRTQSFSCSDELSSRTLQSNILSSSNLAWRRNTELLAFVALYCHVLCRVLSQSLVSSSRDDSHSHIPTLSIASLCCSLVSSNALLPLSSRSRQTSSSTAARLLLCRCSDASTSKRASIKPSSLDRALVG